MNTYRRTATAVGVLYIVGTVAGALSWPATAGLLDGPDYLGPAALHANRLRVGALLVMLMGLALAMVAILLFPVLKRYSERLALGYLVVRGALETATYLATATCWLTLVVAAQQPAQSGTSLAAQFGGVGALLAGASTGPLSAVTTVVFSLGALILSYVMYRSGIVPRWLSGWGLIGAVLYLASGLALMFGTDIGLVQMVILVQEMVMAVWLIAKGFSPTVIASEGDRLSLAGRAMAESR